jgi:cell division protein FtsW
MSKIVGRLRGDKVIWLVIMLLALISITAVYSSSSALALKADKSVYSFLFKQMGFVVLGFGTLLLCYIIPLKIYRTLTIPILILSVVLLIYTIFKGAMLNDATRWIKIGGLTIQPSELAKIAVVLYLARIFETSKFETFKEYALKILLPVGTVCILSLYGSVSVALIIGIITLIILICVGIKARFIWITIAIVIGAASILFTVNHFTGTFSRIDTFTARIERFFTSEDEEKELTPAQRQEREDKNYQKEKAIAAIQVGGIFGRGPGNKVVDTLPHPYSDFIYASIIEEWGLFGATIVIMLYLWFFFRCIVIARTCTKTFSTIVVLGLSLLITMQAMLHILVNVGLFPVTGQTLPLISLGGSSYIIMSGAFGIILSVNRTIEIKVEQDTELENGTDIKQLKNG